MLITPRAAAFGPRCWPELQMEVVTYFGPRNLLSLGASSPAPSPAVTVVCSAFPVSLAGFGDRGGIRAAEACVLGGIFAGVLLWGCVSHRAFPAGRS